MLRLVGKKCFLFRQCILAFHHFAIYSMILKNRILQSNCQEKIWTKFLHRVTTDKVAI